jgi:tetratricopeptide (TPR) repeat protein
MNRWFSRVLAAGLVATMLVVPACKSTRKSNQELRDQGAQAFEYGDLVISEQAYREVLERKPEDPVANHGVGLVLLRQGEPMRARTYLAVAYEQAQHDRNKAFEIGGDLAEAIALSGDLAGMSTFLRDAAELHGDVRDYLRWGDMAAKHGDPDSAELAYKTAIRIETTPSVLPYWKLGRFYESIGKTEDAVKRLRQAYYIEPDNAQVIERLQSYYAVVGPTLKLPPSP